ncbi:MAG TPA: cyanophycin synthetase, partial [Bacteroidota bacterium]
EQAGLRGRMEVVSDRRGRTILDVAHNPDGIATLVHALKTERIRPAAIVFGVMADKDSVTMLSALRALGGRIYAAAPRMERALGAAEVGRRAAAAGFEASVSGSVASALKSARKAVRGGDILVTGSHYVVSEALDFLEKQQP